MFYNTKPFFLTFVYKSASYFYNLAYKIKGIFLWNCIRYIRGVSF